MARLGDVGLVKLEWEEEGRGKGLEMMDWLRGGLMWVSVKGVR